MKKKELVDLMMEATMELANVSPASRAVVDGEVVPIHQIAHGAATGLGLAVLMAEEPAGSASAGDLVAAIVNAALDWEKDHGIIGKGRAEHE